MPKNKTMEIEIEGIGPLNCGRVPPIIKRIIEYLDQYPDGKVMPSSLMAARVERSLSHLRSSAAGHPLLNDYRCKSGSGMLYGNKITIAALKEKLKS